MSSAGALQISTIGRSERLREKGGQEGRREEGVGVGTVWGQAGGVRGNGYHSREVRTSEGERRAGGKEGRREGRRNVKEGDGETKTEGKRKEDRMQRWKEASIKGKVGQGKQDGVLAERRGRWTYLLTSASTSRSWAEGFSFS